MICVHPNGKHIFWAKLVDWNAKNNPSPKHSFQLPHQPIREVGAPLQNAEWLLCFLSPRGKHFPNLVQVSERDYLKGKKLNSPFWAPGWLFFIYKLIFFNISSFFKCSKIQAPVYPRGLIWLNLIHHIVTGLIFYSKRHSIFYLLFIVIFIFISQLRQVFQGELALISNRFFSLFL